MRRIIMLLVAAALAGGIASYLLRRKTVSGRRPVGADTPTGTDPAARYDRPGFEDKALGQAVNADMDLVDRLVEEEHGDLAAAQERFAEESAGAPALRRQHRA